ncbi:hypothetical protein PENTCL1PPCAC_4276, partial [Pristionchus entomophagus]
DPDHDNGQVDPAKSTTKHGQAGGTTNPKTRKPVVTHPVTTCKNTLADLECEHKKDLCANHYYLTLMAQQCAATCGCGHSYIEPAPPYTGAATTTTHRTKTRKVAAPPPAAAACVDLINNTTGRSDCGQFSYMCNNKVYFNFMTQQCPRTCGRCQSGR